MTKRISTLILLTLMLVVAGGCKKDKKRINLMPPITGKPGTVTLVMSDELYAGSAGDTLYSILCQEEPALPQSGMEGAEPMFDVVQVSPAGFGNIFKSNRNILIVTIDPALEQAAIRVERDFWAKYQLIIRMAAPTKEELIDLFVNKDEFLITTLRDTEIDREIILNRKYENTELVNQLRRKHNMTIDFPKGWEARVDTGSFIWVQYDPPDITQGVLVHYYPYTDESQLEYENQLIKTEEWLKKRVTGTPKNSYMAIELEAPVYSREFSMDDNYVREIKGLWTMENDYMGGPFISWSFADPDHGRIVTVFGFVYAPKYNKRNHIRKVESLLKTVSFVD